jgi:hypothetical protein
MGDFNIDISKNYCSKCQRVLQNYLRQIIDLGFIHTITPFLSSYPATFKSTSNSCYSHLDYIFLSSNLAHDLSSFNILNESSFLYSSDHLPLSITIFKQNLFNQYSNAYLKQHKVTKQTFMYHKTTFLHWDLFSDKADLLLKLNPLYANCTIENIATSPNSLNAAWEFFSNTVITSAKKHLPKQTTTHQHKSLYTHANSSIYRHIKSLYKYYYKLKKFHDTNLNNNPLTFSLTNTEH